MSVSQSRANQVARFLRSNSGIAGIQAPVGPGRSRLIVPAPFRVESCTSAGAEYLRGRAKVLRETRDVWALVSYTKSLPIDEATVHISLGSLAVFMGALHERNQGAFNDGEGR